LQKNKYMILPDICCSKNPTTCTCFLFVCTTPGPMSLPDTISNFTVYNGIIEVLWLGMMIMFQLRCHRETACHSQPSVMVTWHISVGDGPHVTAAHSARQDNYSSITYHPNSCQTTRVNFFLFFPTL
jgi:hypothetical protein